MCIPQLFIDRLLVAGSVFAAQELNAIVRDPDAPLRTRIFAIDLVLRYASKAKERSLEERLEAIENILQVENIENIEVIMNLSH